MKHGRLDARRRSAVRDPEDGPIDDGSADEGSPRDASADTDSPRDASADTDSPRDASADIDSPRDASADTDSADHGSGYADSDHDRSGAVADDPDRVRRRIRDRAARIERREVAEAISSLEARGGLTDEQRETVRLLGTAIARRLTANPESALDGGRREDPETVHAVARLFDVESE